MLVETVLYKVAFGGRWGCTITQQAEVVVGKPEDLDLMPATHIKKKKGQNQFQKVVF